MSLIVFFLCLDTDSKRSGALKDKSDTYKKLKEDLLRSRRAVSVMTGSDAAKVCCCLCSLLSVGV